MAFGFEATASGLIADCGALPGRQLRLLIDFARAYADAVAIVVCVPPHDIPEQQARLRWIREQFPGVTVLTAADDASIARTRGTPNAELPSDRILEALGSRRFDLYFSPRRGDRQFAGKVGAEFVPCFPAPALLHAPDAFRLPGAEHSLPNPALKRVCIFGPESTGKTTLATQLAAHYCTPHVPEYVRGYLDGYATSATGDDMLRIARGQRAMELACAAQAERLLICDTNLATIALWHDVLFGPAPGWMRDAADAQTYDLWLLTDIDVPFEPDPQRCFPEPAKRAWFMAECVKTLERMRVEPVLLRGPPEARLKGACAAINRLLA